MCAWQNVIISQVWDFCWVDCDEGRVGQGSWSYHKTMIRTNCHGIQAGWEVKPEYEWNEGQWSGAESMVLGGSVGFEDWWYLGTGGSEQEGWEVTVWAMDAENWDCGGDANFGTDKVWGGSGWERDEITGGEEANNLKQRVLERSSVMVIEWPPKKIVVLLGTAIVT